MKHKQAGSGGLFRPINCQFVLQAYVIASLISTSGVDVLMVLTLGFLSLTFIRQASGGFSNSLYALLQASPEERGAVSLGRARG